MQHNPIATDSLKVAEEYNKQHKNVLRDISKLIQHQTQLDTEYKLSSYVNSQNKKYPIYEITQRGYDILRARYLTRKRGSSLLYIAKHRNIDGYYKIGITRNLERRTAQLNVASPTGIEIIGFVEVESPREVENSIHKQLDQYHNNSEWYKLNENILNEILVKYGIGKG